MPQVVKPMTRSRVVNIGDLSENDRQRMYAILCEHFTGVDRDVFESDLSEKDWVIRVEDGSGQIQGFSTLQRMTLVHGTTRVHAFFSGDTVLSRNVMGDASWIPVWTRHVFSEAAILAPEKSYWLLLTATHKTYRILFSCFEEFIPNPNRSATPLMEDLMAQFVRKKFPQEFREECGLVVLSKTIPYRHAGQVERESGNSEHHSATRYFKRINPEFLRGDFLCCFAELLPENMTPLGLRFLLNPVSARNTTTAA